MPGFFEQLCETVAKNGTPTTGLSPADAAVREFFAPLTAESHPPQPVVNSTPMPPDTQSRANSTPMPPDTQSKIPAPDLSRADFPALARMVQQCTNCRLCRSRTNVVFGEGDPNARLMFIGEAPGADEDRQGRPFVGKAGMLLDKMISAMQFSRQEIYIANIVKCRPPENRMPTPEEAQCCIAYLHRQIELVRPEVIVLLGATAAKCLLNVTSGISKMRGRWHSFNNIPVMPTFHPAFLLRQESAKREAWQDLQQVMARFGKYHKQR